jgi:Secretion system C-terminal sorting domain
MKSCSLNLHVILGCLFCVAKVSAQSYYPGGLGNTNLVLWLNANKSSSITQNGANQVSQWADLSSNGYNFVQAVTTQEPVYGPTTGPYNRPALTFTSTSSQYLSTPTLPASISFTAGTSSFAIGSFNAPQTGQGWQRIYDFGAGQASNNITFGRYGASANLYYESWKAATGDRTYTTTSPVINGVDTLYEAIQQGGTAGTLTAVSHYLAGTSQANNGDAGSSKTWVPPSIARTASYIGRSNWAADNYFSGTLSEILLYNTGFNTTQRTIMENYLSAEWGEAISTSKYAPPSSSTYTTNLVGVGYTSAADDFLSNPAGSTDGLGFSSGAGATDFLNTAGYLMAAHNGQSNTIISNATVPGVSNSSGAIGLWNRSWNLEKTGGNSSGLITLIFNFNDYNGTAPNGSYTYDLLYNAADGSFSTGANHLVTTTGTTVSGNTVSFVVNATNLPNGYYTLIWSTTGILPVILTEFTAIKQGRRSLLQWSTSTAAGSSSIAAGSSSTAAGSSRFDIQRGTGNTGFSTIGTVTAAGDSTTPSHYSFTDNSPAPGVNDYRLIMVNRDSDSAYSMIRTLDFRTPGTTAINIYPNPATDRLTITINDLTGAGNIHVINLQGQVLQTVSPASSNTVTIPVNGLAPGIYFVEIITNNLKFVQQFIKN